MYLYVDNLGDTDDVLRVGDVELNDYHENNLNLQFNIALNMSDLMALNQAEDSDGSNNQYNYNDQGIVYDRNVRFDRESSFHNIWFL